MPTTRTERQVLGDREGDRHADFAARDKHLSELVDRNERRAWAGCFLFLGGAGANAIVGPAPSGIIAALGLMLFVVGWLVQNEIDRSWKALDEERENFMREYPSASGRRGQA